MSWKGYDTQWLKDHENKSRPRTGLPHSQPRERPGKLAVDLPGEAPGPGCPLVRFTLRRVRLLDVDAKYSSVKDLLDGLANAGLIPGDQEGQIDLQVYQEKVGHFAEESTVIEIIEAT